MLDGVNLTAAITLILAAAAMVVSGYALIWAIRPIISLLSHDYMENHYNWSKEDEAGYQEYLKNSNWK